MQIEVYSDADEVELQLNGRHIGRTAVGLERKFLARFDVAYEAGTLTAINLRDGKTTEHTDLNTAGTAQLHIEADRTTINANSADLAFITVEFRDLFGTLATHLEQEVTVEVTGAGYLAAFGSARPATESNFNSSTTTTFDGRALAIVRPLAPGQIMVSASSPGMLPSRIELRVEEPKTAGPLSIV
jgi:hypothetical protein